jgi:excisionase family DNA binding protein
VKRTRMRPTELASVLTITEVAEILRMHSSTIYRLVKRGDLPGLKIGAVWRVNRESIDLWLVGKTRATTESQERRSQKLSRPGQSCR